MHALICQILPKSLPKYQLLFSSSEVPWGTGPSLGICFLKVKVINEQTKYDLTLSCCVESDEERTRKQWSEGS